MGWPLLRVDISSSNRAGFAFSIAIMVFFFVPGAAFLDGLQPSGIGEFDQFCLCAFQLHGNLILLFDKLLHIFAVGGNPQILQLFTEHASQLGLI